jgi:hypothetical protein
MLKFYQKSGEVRSRAQRSCSEVIPRFEESRGVFFVPSAALPGLEPMGEP